MSDIVKLREERKQLYKSINALREDRADLLVIQRRHRRRLYEVQEELRSQGVQR